MCALFQMISEQENETKNRIEELELTIKMQKGIIEDLEKRLAEEKRLCAEWRKRALIAEKAVAKRDVEDAVTYSDASDAAARNILDTKGPYTDYADGVFRKAICTFGERAQKLKTVEELLELGLALVRDQLGRTDLANITEERADVGIMLRQLDMIVNDSMAVDTWTLEKVERLNEMLEGQHGN